MMDFLHWLSTWGLTNYFILCVGLQVKLLRKELDDPYKLKRSLNLIYGKLGSGTTKGV